MTSKEFYIAVIWTVVGLLVAIFFFIQRERPVPVNVPDVPAGKRREKSGQFVLITLNDLVIRSGTCDPIQDNLRVLKKFVEVCEATSAGVIALFTGDGPDVKLRVHAILEKGGIFEAGLKPHRVIYSQTVEGRVSMGRQIQPLIFLESSQTVVDQLQGKVARVANVEQDFAEYLNKYITEME